MSSLLKGGVLLHQGSYDAGFVVARQHSFYLIIAASQGKP